MERVSISYILKPNYRDLLGDWVGPLNQLIRTPYMFNLMVFLNEVYNDNMATVVPRKELIFRPFIETPFSKLKVVILSDEPANISCNNGLAFGINNDVLNPPYISKKIRDCIETTINKDRLVLDFDYSMKKWADQGVLMLNASLTTKIMAPTSHMLAWKNFTRNVIKSINQRKENVVFILLGNAAREFKHLIDINKNHVIEYMHPKQALANNIPWNCPAFGYTNEIIKKKKGIEFCIEW